MLREKQLILLQHILTIGWKYNGFIHANSTFPQRKHVRRGEKKKKKENTHGALLVRAHGHWQRCGIAFLPLLSSGRMRIVGKVVVRQNAAQIDVSKKTARAPGRTKQRVVFVIAAPI